MGLFDKMKEPIFLKESSNAEAQLEKLKALEPLLNATGQALIRQDIKNLEYGIVGEKQIAFELKNSHMTMYILHDVYLEDEELTAQIDYLVFTRKLCFVIECKNLYGDIEIDNAGNFIRTTEYNRKKKKEGIYSPITQNIRHLELMKKIKVDNRKNIITRFMTNKFFEDFYKTVVVLANPKTVLKATYAKKEVKNQVIRGDQLVKYIKDTYRTSKEEARSDKDLLNWAQSYIDLHKEVSKDYTKRYDKYRLDKDIVAATEELEEIENIAEDVIVGEPQIPVEETDIFKELKAYRLNKSREEKIKPYFIYNDNQLKDLISKMPRTKEELKTVAGFGDAKVDKYGDDILKIVGKRCQAL